jgi:hypothetical protein
MNASNARSRQTGHVMSALVGAAAFYVRFTLSAVKYRRQWNMCTGQDLTKIRWQIPPTYKEKYTYHQFIMKLTS